MKIFLSLFKVSVSFLFFTAAYACIFYLSTTIQKDYMFLFCNSLLVFICLNSRSSVSLEKDRPHELAGKRQVAGYSKSSLQNKRRIVGVQLTYCDDYGDQVVGDDKTLQDNVEVTRADQLDAPEEDMTLSVIKETKGDELEPVEDDKTLSVIEETQDYDSDVVEDAKTVKVIEELQDDDFELVKDAKTLSVIEELQDDEFKVVEDDTTLSITDDTQDDELEIVEGDKTLSVVEETCNDDEQKQGGGVDTISLEELNRKCEEFIRRMKKDIRIEILTI